jgi:hypothetical protein
MKTIVLFKYVIISGLFLLILSSSLLSQKKAENEFYGKADLYKAKMNAIDYLSNAAVIRKFGIISDSKWGFAELEMVAYFYGSAAWKGLNAGAKVMAGTTLDLNKDLMNKFREALNAAEQAK